MKSCMYQANLMPEMQKLVSLASVNSKHSWRTFLSKNSLGGGPLKLIISSPMPNDVLSE
jgi:hypothetical protein